MAVRAVVDPDVLIAAEGDVGDGADERSVAFILGVFKGDANGVRIIFVAIDEHERPISIGAMNGVGGDEQVAFRVVDIGGGRNHLMDAGAMLNPLKIDHVRGVVRRGVAFDFVVFVGDEIRPGRPAEAGVVDGLRLDW